MEIDKDTMLSFKREIAKLQQPRVHKITGSLGTIDAFKYYKKSKPSEKEYVLSDKQYRYLILQANKFLVAQLFEQGEVKFPMDMGKLKLYKRVRKPIIKDGKLLYNAPVDWNKTFQLWASDAGSREAKIVIKLPPGDSYSLSYSLSKSKVINLMYFMFTVSRSNKQILKNKINNNEIKSYYSNNNTWHG